MPRCRHLVLVGACGGWALLAAWGALAAEPDPDFASVRRGRPVWRPERPDAPAVADRRATREQGPVLFPASQPLVAEPPSGDESPGSPDHVVGDAAVPEPFVGRSPMVGQETPRMIPWQDGEDTYPASGPDLPVLLGEENDIAVSASSLQLFAGVHGFKGPTDLGRNGNFGFHEGLNWAGPLGDPWGYGYQVGFQAVHSNFSGSQTAEGDAVPDFDVADRNQVFLTAGIFRRPLGSGLQGGTAFDVFYDSYYHDSTLYQIRSETALVLGDFREIGYWGAYGVSKKSVSGLGEFDTLLDPTDLFALFYRRRFTGGGRGRLWAGLSGNGDVICGLDGTVPLGTNWALENNFTCLYPKQGPRGGGQSEESWSVSIQLVWYPGRLARHVFRNRYHPLFYVADNSWFLVDRRN